MDQLVKLRGSYRGSFTTFTKKIQDFIQSKVDDRDSCAGFLAQLQEKYVKIETIDKQILDILLKDEKCTQTMLDEEIEHTENYNGIFIDLKAKLELHLNISSELNETQREIDSNSARGNYKLPKIEFQKFDGNLKNYLSFWGLFQKIHEDPSISDIDKFQYLIQSTLKGSRAREVVESFPVTAENYQQAIECLNSRFGREDVLIEVYVRELLSLVLSNALGQEHKLPIIKLYDRIEAQLRSLKMLGVTSDKYASMLYPLVESSLPVDLLRVWERHLNSLSIRAEEKSFNKLELLMQFLRSEIEGEEKINLATSGFGIENKTKRVFQNRSKLPLVQNNTIPTGMELLASTREKSFRGQQCIFCDKPHANTACKKAENMTYEQKREILIKRGACFRCLKLNHISSSCRARCNCTICGRSHHFLLCRNNQKSSIPSKSDNKNDGVVSEQTLANVSSSPCILLQTLAVILRGEKKCLKIRAIIDSASQRSYILKSTAEEIGYQSIRKEELIHSLFGGTCTNVCEHDVYKAHIASVDDRYRCNFDVLGQSSICETSPAVTQELCQDDLSSLGIHLNDSSGPIQLLIGADVAGKLMTGKLKRLKSGLTAVETNLGWTVLGRTKEYSEQTENFMVISMLTRDVRITDLWELDCLGIKDPAEKQSKEELEDIAKEHFVKTLKKDASGRYTVSLPWVIGHQDLPDNKNIAERRLMSTVKTLQNKGLIEEYENVFNQWLDEQIIEEVKSCELDEVNCHYLPHRAVIKEHSTTKIRPVFDASAKRRNSLSLNDCLEKGPNYIELIPSILNKFRLNKFGVIADIRKAFLQIGISEDDRNFLRFLWWEGGNPDKIKVFRHRRVVFGVNSSAFLLGATLNFHLDNVPDHLKETASRLKKSMYVDNCVTSCKSKEELMNFIEQSKEIMSSACFDLRGWVYNDEQPDILRNEIIPVLGLNWTLSDDTLSCNMNFMINENADITKRTILSLASQLFDPIGFTCPMTLIPKLLMQECWRRKLPWDSKLPVDIERKFTKWKRKLKSLKDVKIPRRILDNYESEAGLSFHVFCDASQYAYAACIFLRNENGCDVECQLVQARARVAPLKSVSVSRLELLACCVGVRLMKTTKKDFPFGQIPVFYWTDSMNALYWIRNRESWAVFVMNRVNEIRASSSKEEWNHVPGYLNPADLPSRGCNTDVLIKSRWWEGPQFLKLPAEEWPRKNIVPDIHIVNSEKKKSIISAMNTEEEKFYERYSSYSRLLRITAWIYRFITNLRNRNSRTSGCLTAKDISCAELILLRIVQREEFPEDVRGQRLKTLHPLVDERGLLRVETRIFSRQDKRNFRLPVILPSKHRIVSLLIEHEHKILGHAGVQILMNRLREKYWILQGRKTIRRVLSRCIRCKRFTAKHPEPKTVYLPENRVKNAAVFEVIGVDLAGPLYIKEGTKAWIVLYTCAVFRAVHLELITSLTTESFLQSFRRFIARRGRPSIIYSDNASNFVKAQKEIGKVDWKEIERESERMTWKFIPPSAPWWGGWWERLVGLMKQILRRVLGQAQLSYEELQTVLCDTENLINSRPLTYLSEDVEDLVALSPLMFLQEIKENGVPDIDKVDTVYLRKRCRYIQKVREDLRKRFRIEYLGQLKYSEKSKNTSKPISVGEVVLIGSDNLKRLLWPIGRVVELLPGKDGITRVVKLKTKFGILTRPVQRVYPLEISESDDGSLMRDKLCQSEQPKQKNVSNTSDDLDGAPIVFKPPVRVSRSGRTVKPPDRLNL